MLSYLQYLDYLKTENLNDYIRYAYQRVCMYHLTNKTGLHLDWAAFEEDQGTAMMKWVQCISLPLLTTASLCVCVFCRLIWMKHISGSSLFSPYVGLCCVGNLSGALQALQNGLKHLPNKAILSLRQIGVMRRMQSDAAKLEDSFEAAIQNGLLVDASLGEFFTIKQARYHLKVKNNKDKAIEVIRGGLQRDPVSEADSLR